MPAKTLLQIIEVDEAALKDLSENFRELQKMAEEAQRDLRAVIHRKNARIRDLEEEIMIQQEMNRKLREDVVKKEGLIELLEQRVAGMGKAS